MAGDIYLVYNDILDEYALYVGCFQLLMIGTHGVYLTRKLHIFTGIMTDHKYGDSEH